MAKASILLVDDRPENLLTLETLLEGPDVSLVKAESGYDALGLTLDHEFALVLLDVQMPGMDGYETAELLRGNKKTRHIPIIFVTAGNKDREHIFKGYDSGGVDYLFKPLEPEVLKSKVGVFLELHRKRIELERKTRELDAKIAQLEEVQLELERSNQKLKLLSASDGLTGLANRRCFDETFLKEWKRCSRENESLSLIIVDIDHFKAYNDFYGHIAGDSALKQVAQALDDALMRPVDVACRYGGEEFTIILPGTDRVGAELVARRMQKSLQSIRIKHEAPGTSGFVTISMGVVSTVPNDKLQPTQLLETADQELYRAKEGGRDCYRIVELTTSK